MFVFQPEIVRKLNLSKALFTDFFAGTTPAFVVSKARRKGPAKTINTVEPEPIVSEEKRKTKRKDDKMKKKGKNGD